MKTGYKAIGLSVLFGVVVWLVGAALDSLLFHEETFWGALIFRVPPRELALRILVLVSFVVYGVILARVLSKRSGIEEAHRTSSHFLDSILNSIQDGISVLDTDLTIRHVNRVMEEWYRANLPLRGKKCYRAYQNRERPCEPCPTLKCIGSGRTEREVVAGLPGSPVEWIELFSYPIKDPDSGTVTGVVEFVRDISDRKRAEEELRRHRENLKEMIRVRTAELEEAQEQLLVFKRFAETSEQGMGWADLEGRIVYINRALCRMFGEQNPEDSYGKLVQSTYYSESIQKRLNETVFPEVLREGKWSGESEIRTAHGKALPTFESLFLIRDREGKPLFFANVLTDITERKRTEEELKRHREHLEELVRERTDHLRKINEELQREIAERKRAREDLARRAALETALGRLRERLLQPAPLLERLVRISDTVVSAFDADFCRIWMIRQGDLCDVCMHRSVTKLAVIPEPDGDKFLEMVGNGLHDCIYRDLCLHLVASSGRYTHTDGKVHRRVPFGCYKIGRVAAGIDRSFITNEVQTDPRVHDHEWAKRFGLRSFAGYRLTSSGGKPLGVLALFSKHRIKPHEHSLLEGMADTASLVIQAGEAEEELREYRDRLEELVQERTEELESFSYSVSHDLRAPLRAIDGFSLALLEDCHDRLDAEGKRLLDVIRTNTRNMGELIDDLLAFSRLGRAEMRITDIDMGGLAGDVFEEIRRSCPGRALRCAVMEVPPARGDRSMMRQVFANLLSNAAKFTRARPESEIEIGGLFERDRNVYYVKDNGVGFDPRYAHKLFEVFQRLHSAEDYRGTGVGLAIVKRIVLRHGGRVWAEGKVGEGATFYFSLPQRAS